MRVVAYANDVKTARAAAWPPALLEAHGAVSEPVARAMAEGIRDVGGRRHRRRHHRHRRAGRRHAGQAGRHRGRGRGHRRRDADRALFRFFGERELVKFQASQAGLDMVRRVLQGHPSAPGGTRYTGLTPVDRPAAVIMTAILLVVAYLLGSLPFGLWLARSEGVDLRATGSGNIGATNVLRTTGRLLAAVVLALDSARACWRCGWHAC